MTKDERSSISDKMSKYIIGSCFKKMYRRAFNWTSTFMIANLQKFSPSPTEWSLVPITSTVAIKPDRRLSTFLNATTEDRPDSKTFGQWVMTYHPGLSNGSPSLDDFLTNASGPSDYYLDCTIAAAFQNLLVSSLYAYLCLMKRLGHFISKADDSEDEIRRYVGAFSNATRILYLVTHSNAMKAFFTYVNLLLPYPNYSWASFNKSQVDGVISNIFTRMNWDQPDGEVPETNDEGDGESYVEEFKDSEDDARLIYRRSFMSFVDHHAGLRLLERRSLYLPPEEKIKLSLIAVKHPQPVRYFPWEEMEKVIHKTCQDFRSTTPNLIEGQDMIDKIKGHLHRIQDDERAITDRAIANFRTLLKIHHKSKRLDDSQYPFFNNCIHCESSLAALLYQLHHTLNESDLYWLFQACPSSLIFTLPDL
jgi:hypothetical protein